MGIYEQIKKVDTVINDNSKLINRVVDQIKQTKIGRNIIHEYNSNLNQSINLSFNKDKS